MKETAKNFIADYHTLFCFPLKQRTSMHISNPAINKKCQTFYYLIQLIDAEILKDITATLGDSTLRSLAFFFFIFNQLITSIPD